MKENLLSINNIMLAVILIIVAIGFISIIFQTQSEETTSDEELSLILNQPVDLENRNVIDLTLYNCMGTEISSNDYSIDYEKGTITLLDNTSINPFLIDLISYYSFDTNANDDYGNNDGVVYGATNISDCKLNNCYDFDGINDYINCGNDSTLNLGSDNFSIVSWVKIK